MAIQPSCPEKVLRGSAPPGSSWFQGTGPRSCKALPAALKLRLTCTLANERHTAAETVWAQEKKDLALEISELVADLDKVSAEKDAAVTELTAWITALETQATVMEAQLERARTAEQQASSTAADAAARVAAAEARADTLHKAHDAFLQRIVPEAPASE